MLAEEEESFSLTGFTHNAIVPFGMECATISIDNLLSDENSENIGLILTQVFTLYFLREI